MKCNVLAFKSSCFGNFLMCLFFLLKQEDSGPLEGVIICVSRKLGGNQNEYNTMVVELGGDYVWQFSKDCTHFIFQVRHFAFLTLSV